MATEETATILQPRSEKRFDLNNPGRFKTASSTLFIDRFMTHFIKFGGIGIIAAVMGIFVFILWQVLPLFQGAEVKEIRSLDLGRNDFVGLGSDEWSEKPFLLDASGSLHLVDSRDGSARHFPVSAPEGSEFSFTHVDTASQSVLYGTADGKVKIVKVLYSADFEGGKRVLEVEIEEGPFYVLAEPGWRVVKAALGASDSEKMIAAVLEAPDGRRLVRALAFSREASLFGTGEETQSGEFDLTPMLGAAVPDNILADNSGENVLVSTRGGDVHYFHREGPEIEKRQVFSPFKNERNPEIHSMNYVFGDVSAVFTNPEGLNHIFSIFIDPGLNKRLFGKTKEFPPLAQGASFYSASLRNKAFLTGAEKEVSLRYTTTESVRWQADLPFHVKDALIGSKYNRLLFLDTDGKLHFYELKDPHPEASLSAFFGKQWYEGAAGPRYEWQSTGGSDEFEPKLSMIPLIVGTLKGTFYAMLFAVPIALIAAIYTSQFLRPKLRQIVKPTMEIMASLPSVVLGFLAALWFAPLMETQVPAFLVMVVLLPVSAVLMGSVAGALPHELKKFIKPGYEFIYFFPIFVLVIWFSLQAGPAVERLFFVATDPSTGQRIPDFRLWWPQVTGAPFEQRNSLAVGFMMGFAVIPIIFTITEDSLSNVPSYLRAGSLALGATRWQTALRVVLPTASAGIFSAIMIGLGRAIGETMIVVMATGNTPIMDFNIFSGMRTLSANIAVELPEAPHHGTLYRTLFLGALVLFMATFFVNTVAEIQRQRLREKYKTV